MHALEVKLAPELLRKSSGTGCGIACLPLRLRQGSVDLAVVMWLLGSWPGGEVRQLAQQYVQLYRASFDRHRANFLSPCRICCRIQHVQCTDRICIRD